MTEQELDSGQISPSLKKMCGKTVTHGVCRHGLRETSLYASLGTSHLHDPYREGLMR